MIFLARWRKIMRWKVGRGRWSPTPTPMEINIRQKLVLKLVFRNWAVHTAHTRTHHALYRRTKLTAKIYFTETNSHWMFAPSISTANERYEEQISENRIHAKPATSVRKHQLHRNPNILRVISLGINFCRSMEFLGEKYHSHHSHASQRSCVVDAILSHGFFNKKQQNIKQAPMKKENKMNSSIIVWIRYIFASYFH